MEYQSLTEGSWVKLSKTQLNQKERELILSNKEEDKEAKKELITELNSKIPVEDINKINVLESFYNSIKPELKENDSYELIAINLREKENMFSGILNYRINDTHKQIRF